MSRRRLPSLRSRGRTVEPGPPPGPRLNASGEVYIPLLDDTNVFMRNARQFGTAAGWLLAASDAIGRRDATDLQECQAGLAQLGWRLEKIAD